MSILRAEGGEQEVQEVSGPTSYDSGNGFTADSDLERVDQFVVYEDSDSVTTRKNSVTGDNKMVVDAYSVDTGNSALSEYADGADLSNDNFTVVAYKL
jgi:hypothetical protein